MDEEGPSMKQRRHTPEPGDPQVARGRPAARGGQGRRRGLSAPGGLRADVSPLAQPVGRDEGRRRQAFEGARARERAAEGDRGRPGAGVPGAEGGREGKLVSPARRRRAVVMLRDRLGVSERWACRVTGQHRSTQRREPVVAADDEALRAALRAFAGERKRWGYRRAHEHLVAEGWQINRKRVQRVWREEGLRVPRRARRRPPAGDGPDGRAIAAAAEDDVWAIDFQADQTADGRPLRLINVLDEHTRQALTMSVGRSASADQVVGELERLITARGRAPRLLRMDNGPELTSHGLRDWWRFNDAQ